MFSQIITWLGMALGVFIGAIAQSIFGGWAVALLFAGLIYLLYLRFWRRA